MKKSLSALPLLLVVLAFSTTYVTAKSHTNAMRNGQVRTFSSAARLRPEAFPANGDCTNNSCANYMSPPWSNGVNDVTGVSTTVNVSEPPLTNWTYYWHQRIIIYDTGEGQINSVEMGMEGIGPGGTSPICNKGGSSAEYFFYVRLETPTDNTVNCTGTIYGPDVNNPVTIQEFAYSDPTCPPTCFGNQVTFTTKYNTYVFNFDSTHGGCNGNPGCNGVDPDYNDIQIANTIHSNFTGHEMWTVTWHNNQYQLSVGGSWANQFANPDSCNDFGGTLPGCDTGGVTIPPTPLQYWETLPKNSTHGGDYYDCIYHDYPSYVKGSYYVFYCNPPGSH